MSDFLTAILESSRRRVAADKERRPLSRPVVATCPGRLRAALNAASSPSGGVPSRLQSEGRVALIAEVKRRSPSKGDIDADLDAVAQALAYEAAGADAVSVLTEPARFGGCLEDLRDVAAAIGLPVLRKDFVVDPYQVWEAAEAGAAAVLLIAAALDDGRLGALLGECRQCGLDALIEVHDEVEMARAASVGAELIGVNSRDLRSLHVDLGVTERLAGMRPAGTLLIAESGIASAGDALRVARAGAHAILVGEALVRCPREDLHVFVASLRHPPAVATEVTP